MAKLHKLSRVKLPYKDIEIDSVKESRQGGINEHRRAQDILLEAQGYYNSMYKFRRDRERNKRYNFGDQWGDVVCVNGCQMTEEEYILKQGNVPLKNNLIRRLVRNVIGVYRQQATEPTCTARDRDEQQLAETMSTVLQYNMQLNCMNEVYARSFEEYLISGLIVHRKWFGWRNDKMECWTDYVQPNNFFIDNNMRDFRGWDCSFIGEIHDIDFNSLCQAFAKTKEDYQRLSDIYRSARDNRLFTQTWEYFGYSNDYLNSDFLTTRNESLCRVIEVWKKESKPRYRCHDYNNGEIFKIDIEDYEALVENENNYRRQLAHSYGISEEETPLIQAEWFVDTYWYFYFLSPFGDILSEGETPYKHKGHPYVFKAYPYIDGEIHSFVADVIDQQRYTNRLITLYDWIMRASAKGVLLIPEQCIPDDMSAEEFAEAWVKFNGVVVYKQKAGIPSPQQISNNSTNIGINELLQLQLKFFEDISGVNGALQGKTGYAGTSAALYNQQTQNATTSLLDLLDSYEEFRRDAAYKDVKNIQQFYDQPRVYNIAGKAGKQIIYDPKKIQDVEFDLSVVQSQATPSYRAISNDFLMEIWRQNQISLEQLLETGDFPFADALLQNIKAQKEQMSQGNVPEGMSPELQQQVQSGANMQAVNQLQTAMKGLK